MLEDLEEGYLPPGTEASGKTRVESGWTRGLKAGRTKAQKKGKRISIF